MTLIVKIHLTKLFNMINWYTFINSNVLQNKKININGTHILSSKLYNSTNFLHT